MPDLPKNMLALTEDLTVPALPDADIQRLARLVDASPEEFQAAASSLLRRLAVAGFQNLRPPKTYRDLATVLDLIRKAEQLDKADKGSVVPVGLVVPMRSISRRPIIEAEPADPGFE